ncbi:MAG TPA: selenocysteine-specific translation elongation factor [Gemmatimonadales bacterium]|jgi:selenocysteine-specific elongation factor|nr:selenocysteine-specific translation elongation factor [Gemmatimonadales bacterium]
MIIGTAGHIDHGKSALVTALTGRPMDRLAEEKRRGITIDLNFAPLELEGLPPAGIVDVPGHEDFVRTMVAGASGIDLVLLVVDAVQGPQPQTWEHLAIVEQLGVPRGIPVITKADLAEPEWLELVVAEVAERLAASPVEFESPAIVSAVTGQGIPELAARLRTLRATHRRERPEDGFRMPVDRAFSIAGVGTVVTGTPWSGALRIGDPVSLLPSGLAGRVRSLEAYGAAVSAAEPGARTAVGIAGIERAAIHRGETLVDRRLSWRSTSALDALLELLPDAPPLRRQLRVRVHLGTAEVLARVYPREEIIPGGRGMARLALERPLVARGNDRFVLRSYSPVLTIGGGRVVDPFPPRRAAVWPQALAALEPSRRAEALVLRRPAGIPAETMPLLLGEPLAGKLEGITLIAGRYLSAEIPLAIKAAALSALDAFHRKSPAEPGLSLETLRRALPGPQDVVSTVLESMVREGELKLAEGVATLPGFVPRLAGGEELTTRVVAALEQAGLEPPSLAELERQLGHTGLLPVLRHAAQQGRVMQVESDRYFSLGALQRFVEVVRELAAEQAITPSALRERLHLSRKYLIPLLEWADRSGVTRRVGDQRVLVQV